MERSQLVSTIAKYCEDNIKDMDTTKLPSEYYYASMPLCVVDAVFSIGVRYEGVQNVIKRLCDYYEIEQFCEDYTERKIIKDQRGSNEISTTEFLKLIDSKTPEQLAEEVYQNRQRTSARNGILKAEAVIRFLNVLKEFKAEYFQDIPRLIGDGNFGPRIKEIHGQQSGISLKYFFMLAGTDDLIKPDRMIKRFLHNATGLREDDLAPKQCQDIFVDVTNEFNKRGQNLTPRLLDYIIWNYQRKQESPKA